MNSHGTFHEHIYRAGATNEDYILSLYRNPVNNPCPIKTEPQDAISIGTLIPPQHAEIKEEHSMYDAQSMCFQAELGSDGDSSVSVNMGKCDSNQHYETEDSVPRKKKRRSLASVFDGRFFELKSPPSPSQSNTSQTIARCLLCKSQNKTIKGAIGVSSNFLQHLRRQHPDEYKEYFDRKGERSLLKKPEPPSINKEETAFEGLLNFIVDAELPLSVVENKYFKLLLSNSPVRAPTKEMTTELMESKFKKQQNEIKLALKNAMHVCTTADIWACKSRSFFGYTCHWLDNEQKRCSIALACKQYDGAYTSDQIDDLIYSINSEYGLNGQKLIATLTANGCNFSTFFREFGVVVNEFDADIRFQTLSRGVNQPKHIKCASQTLTLITSVDFMKHLKENIMLYQTHIQAFAKCSNLWEKARCPKSSDIISMELGMQLNYPIVTRWNTVYESVLKLLSIGNKLYDLCLKLGIPTFTADDIMYLKDYIVVMQPFAEALNFLQGPNGIFYGTLIPSLVTIKTKVHRIISDEKVNYLKDELIFMGRKLIERFEPYFMLTAEVDDAIVAAILHPEVKLRWYDAIKDLAARSADELKNLVISYVSDIEGRPANSDIKIKAAEQSNSFFDFGDERNNSDSRRSTEIRPTEREVLLFLSDPSCNNLINLTNFPLLQASFRKANTPLVSAVPVEKLYSFEGIVNDQRRHTLSHDHFEMLILMKANAHVF